MTHVPGSNERAIVNALLRRVLDPAGLTADRHDAAAQLSALSIEARQQVAEDPRFRLALAVLDRTRPASSHSVGVQRQSRIAVDLRVLIQDSISGGWQAPRVAIRHPAGLIERARICADAAVLDQASPAGVAACAWVQLAAAPGLLNVHARWPDSPAFARDYVEDSLLHGAARHSLPVRLARAILREAASRPHIKLLYDEAGAWMAGWIAASPLGAADTLPSGGSLAELLVTLRAGCAIRAYRAQVRLPRALRLLDLIAAVTVLRFAGRLDLLRSHRAAGGDITQTLWHLSERDRRGDLSFETAVGAVLGAPRTAGVVLLRDEVIAMDYVDRVIASDHTAGTSGVLQ